MNPMLKPKVGDMVRFKTVTVKNVSEEGTFTVEDWVAHYRFSFDVIEEIVPRPIAVGDKVIWIHGMYPGRVFAIRVGAGSRPDMAWVETDLSGDAVFLISELTRVSDAGAR